jgi:glycosyltransferase involved in cell wall biosynthesis
MKETLKKEGEENPIKILIMEIIRRPYANGAQIHRIEVAKNLSQIGHDVYVTSIENENLDLNGMIVNPIVDKKPYLIFILNYIIQLINIIKRDDIDIIITRSIGPGVVALILRELGKTKLIFEENGIVHEEFLMQKDSTKFLGGLSFDLKAKIIKSIDLLVARRSDAIYAVTPEIKNYLVQNGVDIRNVYVIGNGANTNLFRPMMDAAPMNHLKERYGIENHDRVVIFVGSIEPWQGLNYLIWSAKIIINKYPNIKFMIVGDGSKKEDLMNLSEKLGVSNNFIFTGAVPYEDVPKYINISDICVAPFVSERNESTGLSPLKIFEYLSCGKPVISSRMPNLEFIENQNVGLLVEPENSEELAKAIIEILKNGSSIEEMGRNGREYVVRYHSWKAVASELSSICYRILMDKME